MTTDFWRSHDDERVAGRKLSQVNIRGWDDDVGHEIEVGECNMLAALELQISYGPRDTDEIVNLTVVEEASCGMDAFDFDGVVTIMIIRNDVERRGMCSKDSSGVTDIDDVKGGMNEQDEQNGSSIIRAIQG